MNDWLRTEGEQRGAWLAQRVQDVRAAQPAARREPAKVVPQRVDVSELAPTIPLRRGVPTAAEPAALTQESCAEVA
jgi:hypothetical protein